MLPQQERGAAAPFAAQSRGGHTVVDTLAGKTCTPCKGGIPPLAAREAQAFAAQVPQWELGEEARILTRTFRFANFREALAFVVRVGELAEAEGHHPDVSFGWGRATVSLQTKKIKGLHENDFIVAAKIDRLQPHREGVSGPSR
jgi:4a-hydroxytetrahydrobiopterin dehydratase